MAVFVLQLLPVKQAIRYFFVDNITVEEIVHTTKTPVKPLSFIDEDHLLSDLHLLDHPFIFFNTVLSALHSDMLPSLHADDVETPPPNAVTA